MGSHINSVKLKGEITKNPISALWEGHIGNNVSGPTDTFDYQRFTAYLKIQSQLERQMRIQQLRQGQVKPWLSLDFYTDKVLGQELSLIYGDLNKSTPLYSKIFANYKETRLDEIQEWIKEEKEMIHNLIHSKQQVVDPNYETPLELRIDLLDYFTVDELESFSRLCAPLSPFNLPREHLLNRQLDKRTQTGQLRNIMDQHFTGISPEVLFRKLNPERKISGAEHLRNFIERCVAEPSFLYLQEIPNINRLLLFPAEAAGLIVSPRVLFTNILHKLEFVFAYENPQRHKLAVSKIVEKFHNLFKFQLSSSRLQAWGFSNNVPFLMFLLQLFDSSKIWCMAAADLSLPGDFYYIVSKEYYQQIIKAKKMMAQTQSKQRKLASLSNVPSVSLANKLFSMGKNEIPTDCMGVGDRIETTSDWIASVESNRRKKEFHCILLDYFTPTDFYVMLWEDRNQLQKFQSDLTLAYDALDSTCDGSLAIGPNFKFSAGLYLIVIQDRDGNKGYYRGEYVERRSCDGLHRIFLVDHGEFVNVEVSQLRFLRKYMAHELRLQAIWCGIYNILPQTTWNKGIVGLTYDMISHTSVPFTAKFMNQIKFKGKDQWFIKAAGTNRQKYPDVGEILKTKMPSLDVVVPTGRK